MLYSIDWSNDDKTETQNAKFRSFDGEKITKKLPEVFKDDIIVSENLPIRFCRELIEAGAKVLRCCPTYVSNHRKLLNLEKTDDNDVKIIFDLYKVNPEYFYEWQYDKRLTELAALVDYRDQIQKLRIVQSNREFATGSEIFAESKTELKLIEKQTDSKIRKLLKEFPIWTKYLSKIQGIAFTTAAKLIAYIGDIRRFKNFSSFCAYFGTHVVNGEAPRLTKGKPANWHKKGRMVLLGQLGASFVKQKECEVLRANGKIVKIPQGEYRDIYEHFRKKEEGRIWNRENRGNTLKTGEPIPNWLIFKRAIRKTIRVFMKRLFKEYKKMM